MMDAIGALDASNPKVDSEKRGDAPPAVPDSQRQSSSRESTQSSRDDEEETERKQDILLAVEVDEVSFPCKKLGDAFDETNEKCSFKSNSSLQCTQTSISANSSLTSTFEDEQKGFHFTSRAACDEGARAVMDTVMNAEHAVEGAMRSDIHAAASLEKRLVQRESQEEATYDDSQVSDPGQTVGGIRNTEDKRDTTGGNAGGGTIVTEEQHEQQQEDNSERPTGGSESGDSKGFELEVEHSDDGGIDLLLKVEPMKLHCVNAEGKTTVGPEGNTIHYVVSSNNNTATIRNIVKKLDDDTESAQGMLATKDVFDVCTTATSSSSDPEEESDDDENRTVPAQVPNCANNYNDGTDNAEEFLELLTQRRNPASYAIPTPTNSTSESVDLSRATQELTTRAPDCGYHESSGIDPASDLLSISEGVAPSEIEHKVFDETSVSTGSTAFVPLDDVKALNNDEFKSELHIFQTVDIADVANEQETASFMEKIDQIQTSILSISSEKGQSESVSPNASDGGDDDDGMDQEWKQLALYEADLKRELEDSIRVDKTGMGNTVVAMEASASPDPHPETPKSDIKKTSDSISDGKALTVEEPRRAPKKATRCEWPRGSFNVKSICEKFEQGSGNGTDLSLDMWKFHMNQRAQSATYQRKKKDAFCGYRGAEEAEGTASCEIDYMPLHSSIAESKTRFDSKAPSLPNQEDEEKNDSFEVEDGNRENATTPAKEDAEVQAEKSDRFLVGDDEASKLVTEHRKIDKSMSNMNLPGEPEKPNDCGVGVSQGLTREKGKSKSATTVIPNIAGITKTSKAMTERRKDFKSISNTCLCEEAKKSDGCVGVEAGVDRRLNRERLKSRITTAENPNEARTASAREIVTDNRKNVKSISNISPCEEVKKSDGYDGSGVGVGVGQGLARERGVSKSMITATPNEAGTVKDSKVVTDHRKNVKSISNRCPCEEVKKSDGSGVGFGVGQGLTRERGMSKSMITATPKEAGTVKDSKVVTDHRKNIKSISNRCPCEEVKQSDGSGVGLGLTRERGVSKSMITATPKEAETVKDSNVVTEDRKNAKSISSICWHEEANTSDRSGRAEVGVDRGLNRERLKSKSTTAVIPNEAGIAKISKLVTEHRKRFKSISNISPREADQGNVSGAGFGQGGTRGRGKSKSMTTATPNEAGIAGEKSDTFENGYVEVGKGPSAKPSVRRRILSKIFKGQTERRRLRKKFRSLANPSPDEDDKKSDGCVAGKDPIEGRKNSIASRPQEKGFDPPCKATELLRYIRDVWGSEAGRLKDIPTLLSFLSSRDVPSYDGDQVIQVKQELELILEHEREHHGLQAQPVGSDLLRQLFGMKAVLRANGSLFDSMKRLQELYDATKTTRATETPTAKACNTTAGGDSEIEEEMSDLDHLISDLKSRIDSLTRKKRPEGEIKTNTKNTRPKPERRKKAEKQHQGNSSPSTYGPWKDRRFIAGGEIYPASGHWEMFEENSSCRLRNKIVVAEHEEIEVVAVILKIHDDQHPSVFESSLCVLNNEKPSAMKHSRRADHAKKLKVKFLLKKHSSLQHNCDSMEPEDIVDDVVCCCLH